MKIKSHNFIIYSIITFFCLFATAGVFVFCKKFFLDSMGPLTPSNVKNAEGAVAAGIALFTIVAASLIALITLKIMRKKWYFNYNGIPIMTILRVVVIIASLISLGGVSDVVKDNLGPNPATAYKAAIDGFITFTVFMYFIPLSISIYFLAVDYHLFKKVNKPSKIKTVKAKTVTPDVKNEKVTQETNNTNNVETEKPN